MKSYEHPQMSRHQPAPCSSPFSCVSDISTCYCVSDTSTCYHRSGTARSCHALLSGTRLPSLPSLSHRLRRCSLRILRIAPPLAAPCRQIDRGNRRGMSAARAAPRLHCLPFARRALVQPLGIRDACAVERIGLALPSRYSGLLKARTVKLSRVAQRCEDACGY